MELEYLYYRNTNGSSVYAKGTKSFRYFNTHFLIEAGLRKRKRGLDSMKIVLPWEFMK